MLNRRRITAALIGLLVLVVGAWLIQEVVSGGGTDGKGGGSLPGVESGPRVETLSAQDGSVFANREKLLLHNPRYSSIVVVGPRR